MLKRTPFYELHKEAGAKLIDFGGFDMPVQYDSIQKEHQAVREAAGLFDVSHMGEFYVTGEEALELIQLVTINDASALSPGKVQYSAMCYEDGGIVDDLLVYMLAENTYMLVVNASNIRKDFKWIAEHNTFEASLQDRSGAMCLLAVQGPRSTEILGGLTDINLSEIASYTFENGSFAGCEEVIVSATGYTGEEGFELYFDKEQTDPRKVWKAIVGAGSAYDLEPCGLGARDTLRLEMGYALYGSDITEDTHPLEARMGWLTKLDRKEFIGKQALVKAREDGLDRRLVGFTIDDKRSIPRSGYRMLDEEGSEIGQVTSGTRSITLNKNIGMGYVDERFSREGSTIFVQIRKKKAQAVIEKPPFLKK